MVLIGSRFGLITGKNLILDFLDAALELRAGRGGVY